MPTLEEIRQQYPAYSNISDDVLAEKLYNKFYSRSLGRNDFYKRIGHTPAEQRGLGGVLRDVGEGLANVPEAAVGIAGAVATDAPGALWQSLTDPDRVGRNLLYGTARLGQGLGNIPSTLGKYLSEKGFIDKETANAIPRDDTDLKAALDALLPKTTELEQMGIVRPQTPLSEEKAGDMLIQGLGELPAWMVPGGAATQATKLGVLGAASETNPLTLAGLAALPKAVGEAGESVKKGIDAIRDKEGVVGQNIPPDVLEVIETSKKTGIPLSTSDLTRPGSLPDKIARKSELLGTFDRGEQMVKAGEASRAALQQEMSAMIAENFGGADGIQKIQKAAAKGGRRGNAAQMLLEDIADAGEDWNKILKTSGNVKLMNNKLKADLLYDKVERLAEPLGELKFQGALDTLDKKIKELSVTPKTNAAEIKILEDLKADLRSPLSFRNARRVRSQLGDKITNYTSGPNALIARQGVDALMDAQEALRGDLKRFATSQGPELKAAWNEADKFYKESIVPLKDRQLARALKTESNPDEIARMFIKTGGEAGGLGTARAQKFYEALDDKGRAAARYDILKRATDKAFNERGEFSPAKYATELEKLKAARAVFFKGEAARELDGLAKLMRYADKATLARPPMTGVQNFPLLAAMMSGKFLGLGKSVGGYYAMKALTNTKIGRNALVNLSYAEPGLKNFTPSLKRANSAIKKVLDNPSKYGLTLGVMEGGRTRKEAEKKANKSKRSKK